MRFTEEDIRDKIGNTRVTKYFAIFPVSIGKETRWLETVKIAQEFKCI